MLLLTHLGAWGADSDRSGGRPRLTNPSGGFVHDLIPDPSIWVTPPFRPEGFQFEIQISSLGATYDPEHVRESIRAHDLGETESVISKTMAAEWGYSFTHLDGETDGAGRRIEAGYPSSPANRAEALKVIEAFLQRQYIRGAPPPWASMNGHYPWHHYAAEFGFDQIGSEIGENINNYQWHIAVNRGAARQYRLPWFIDFSAWHGPSITDYSPDRIWGEHSGPDHGHSMGLFERSLFLSYLAGAGQITAEAGGAIAFLPEQDETGRYRLSPYGEVCKRFRDFTLAHPDVGIPCTPFAILLDFHHGAYPGFGPRKAFGWFDYGPGDDMTWDLIDLIWPGGWEVMGKRETGTLVNGSFGDLFDVLLQNAPQEVLNSYPCLIPSGALHFSEEERKRIRSYVEQGGVLILNTAFLGQFPEWTEAGGSVGEGRVVVYGPNHRVERLAPILEGEIAARLPVRVSKGVHYALSLKPDRLLLTLLNNEGVTKDFRLPPEIDSTKAVEVTVEYTGSHPVRSVREITRNAPLRHSEKDRFGLRIEPGGLAILEIQIDPNPTADR